MSEPFSLRDHDEAVDDFGRVLLLLGGVIIGVTLILVFG